jgi:hypothetical protein
MWKIDDFGPIEKGRKLYVDAAHKMKDARGRTCLGRRTMRVPVWGIFFIFLIILQNYKMVPKFNIFDIHLS